MGGLSMPEWGKIFVPDASLLESFLRGTVVYFAILVIFRVLLKRQLGSLGVTDVMLVVLTSEAVSNSLNAQAQSVPNGVVCLAALVFWNYALDWAGHRWKWLGSCLSPEPLPLIKDGSVLRENLDRERITDEELLSQLRLNGVDDPAAVKTAFIEPEGHVSVVKTDAKPPDPPAPNPAADFDAALARFLDAARVLQSAVVWHDERAAEHRHVAQTLRAALSRHGVRARTLMAADEPPDESEPTGRPRREPVAEGAEGPVPAAEPAASGA